MSRRRRRSARLARSPSPRTLWHRARSARLEGPPVSGRFRHAVRGSALCLPLRSPMNSAVDSAHDFGVFPSILDFFGFAAHVDAVVFG